MNGFLVKSVPMLLLLGAISCGDAGQQSYDWGWRPDTAGDVATGADLAQADEGRPDAASVDNQPGDPGTDDEVLPEDASIDSGPGDLPGDLPGEDATTPADSSEVDTADATVGGFDLTGTWAQLHVTSVMSKPALGSPAPSATTSILLVKITLESGIFFIESDLCNLKLGQTSAVVTTVVPQAFIDSIATVKREMTLVDTDGTVMFTDPEHVDLYGVDLASPLTDDLPENADDPAVYDQDGDGHPGMTIQLKGIISGDFYLIQRTVSSMTGLVDGSDRFDGLIASVTEQVYVGASNEDLLGFIPENYADDDPSHSYYRHTRVDPSWGCAQIVENQDKLFAR